MAIICIGRRVLKSNIFCSHRSKKKELSHSACSSQNPHSIQQDSSADLHMELCQTTVGFWPAYKTKWNRQGRLMLILHTCTQNHINKGNVLWDWCFVCMRVWVRTCAYVCVCVGVWSIFSIMRKQNKGDDFKRQWVFALNSGCQAVLPPRLVLSTRTFTSQTLYVLYAMQRMVHAGVGSVIEVAFCLLWSQQMRWDLQIARGMPGKVNSGQKSLI